MMDDLSLLQQTLNLTEDEALMLLELCAVLRREDELLKHGYPKDTPASLDLQARLLKPEFLVRLRTAAAEDELPQNVVRAIDRMISA